LYGRAKNSSALGLLRGTVPTPRKISSRDGGSLLLGLTLSDDDYYYYAKTIMIMISFPQQFGRPGHSPGGLTPLPPCAQLLWCELYVMKSKKKKKSELWSSRSEKHRRIQHVLVEKLPPPVSFKCKYIVLGRYVEVRGCCR